MLNINKSSHGSPNKPLPVGEVDMSVSELADEGTLRRLINTFNIDNFSSPHPVRAIALRASPQGEAYRFGALSC